MSGERFLEICILFVFENLKGFESCVVYSIILIVVISEYVKEKIKATRERERE